MEPGLAFTLCGLGICFLMPAFILGFINRSKRILVHIYHIMSHRRGQKSRYDIIETIQKSRIFRATIPKYISY